MIDNERTDIEESKFELNLKQSEQFITNPKFVDA